MDPKQGNARTKTASDTTAAIGRLDLRTQQVRILARPDPGTVTPQTSVRDALAQMRLHGGDAVLVKEGRRLVGIVTERDVLTRIYGDGVDQGQPVSTLMTAAVRTLTADASLLEAMQLMESGHFRNVPLTDAAGNVFGLLRQQDLVEYLAEAFPQEILNLPPRPHQLMDEPEGA